jgi:hypothetical protein
MRAVADTGAQHQQQGTDCQSRKLEHHRARLADEMAGWQEPVYQEPVWQVFASWKTGGKDMPQ